MSPFAPEKLVSGDGLAVPSRVSLLVHYTNAESGAYARDSSQCPQWFLYTLTTIHHRVSRDFIGSRNCVPMAFTTESPLCPNIITAVLLLYILWAHFFPPTYLHTSVKSEMNAVQYHPLCPNIVTAVLLLYILWTVSPPPTYVCTSVKSLVYTVQYHMLLRFKTYR